jgi:O-antigen ligase
MWQRLQTIIASPWLLLGVLLLSDILIAAHRAPRSLSYLLAFLSAGYVLNATFPHAITFTIASFPFGPALPIPHFDSFALWRFTVAMLALRSLFRLRANLRTPLTIARIRAAIFPHETIGIALLILGFASLIAAVDPVAGMRKLIFLGNAIALYATVRSLYHREPKTEEAVIRGILVALGGLLLVGFAQYLIVQFVSLYDFWQGWALDWIPVFYGKALGELLTASNTWFSYAEGKLPTLRMFSLLPDSHSFGVTMLLGFLFSLALLLSARLGNAEEGTERAPRNTSFRHPLLSTLLVGCGLAVFLNGSRGIWLGILPTSAVAFFLARRMKPANPHASRTIIASFLLLFLLFPLSSLIASHTKGAGASAKGEEALAFRRAQSIFDPSEVSNKTRLAIWHTTLRSIARRPLLGVGLGNTALALGEDVSAARRGASAHNLYLDVASETGVIGGLLTLAFFLSLLKTFGAPLLRGEREGQDGFSLAAILAATWLGIYNLFDIVLLNDRALLTFLILLAIASSRTRQTA